MHVTQQVKYVQAIKPQAIADNASLTPEVIDTLGFNELALVIQIGATDIAFAALKVQECATSGGSYTDVDGADFSSDGTLPSATDDGDVLGVFINLQNRQRFIKIIATAGDGATGSEASALAILARPETVPSNAASRGLAQELIVAS